VNLRKVGLDRLQKVSGLDRILGIRLLEYRREHGPIRSFYELHYLEGFTEPMIERLRTNAYLGTEKQHDSLSLRESWKELEGRFRLRWGRILQRRRGYRNDNYVGPPSSAKGRLQMTFPELATIGASIEKDAGEAWWGTPEQGSKGLDAYLKLHSQGPLDKLILGPLETKSGGALLLDNGSGFGGGLGPPQGPLFGLNAHTGSPDRSSLRGVGAEFHHQGFRGVFLYSRKKWTARIDTLAEDKKVLSTLYRNGIHRRPRIIKRSGRWERRDMIAQAGWKGKGMAIGASFHRGRASHPHGPPERIRDRARGTERKERGLELHWRKARGRTRASLSFSLEADRSHAFSGAFSTRPYEDILLQGRIEGAGWGYDPFWSPVARRGRPFIEASTRADRLLGAGLRIRISSSVLRVDWPSYGRTGPGNERSFALELIRSGKDEGSAELSIEHESREKDLQDRGLRRQASVRERSLDFELRSSLPIARNLKGRIRIQHKRSFDEKVDPGMLFAHDLIADLKEKDLKIYWRTAVFDAPNYPTRPYAYENDLLYAFSVRSYYRRGWRSYLLLRCSPFEDLTIEGKIGSWVYRDIERIGSGDAAIPGRYRSRLRLQVRGSF
jgi:hypothetical protein